KWPELQALCHDEDVEAAAIGTFEPTGKLKLFYDGNAVGELDMHFMHDGRPDFVKRAEWQAPLTLPSPLSHRGEGGEQVGLQAPAQRPGSLGRQSPLSPRGRGGQGGEGDTAALLAILSSHSVCSKEWIVRQYDHEVQGGSVVKPLVGAGND